MDRMFKEEKLITKSKLALKYNKYKYKYNKKVIKIRKPERHFFYNLIYKCMQVNLQSNRTQYSSRVYELNFRLFEQSLHPPFQTIELAIGSLMKEIFSSFSNTYPFNYLFGDKELLARQIGIHPVLSLHPAAWLPEDAYFVLCLISKRKRKHNQALISPN